VIVDDPDIVRVAVRPAEADAPLVVHADTVLTSGDDAIVIRVRPNPEPEQSIRCVDRKRAIVNADADRVEPIDALEVQRGMSRIRLEQRKLFVREVAHGSGQRVIARPEAGRGMMGQSLRERPAA